MTRIRNLLRSAARWIATALSTRTRLDDSERRSILTNDVAAMAILFISYVMSMPIRPDWPPVWMSVVLYGFVPLLAAAWLFLPAIYAAKRRIDFQYPH